MYALRGAGLTLDGPRHMSQAQYMRSSTLGPHDSWMFANYSYSSLSWSVPASLAPLHE
jgi:hypothetical protein